MSLTIYVQNIAEFNKHSSYSWLCPSEEVEKTNTL